MAVGKFFCLVLAVQITQPVLGRYAFTKHRPPPDYPTLHGESAPISEAQDLDLLNSRILVPQTDARPSNGRKLTQQSLNGMDIANELSNYIEHHNYNHNPVDIHSHFRPYNFQPSDLNIPAQFFPAELAIGNEDDTAITDIIIDIEIDNISEYPAANNNPNIQPSLQNLLNKQARSQMPQHAPNLHSSLARNNVKPHQAITNNGHDIRSSRVVHRRPVSSRYDPDSIMHYSAHPGKLERELTVNPAASKIQKSNQQKSTAQPRFLPTSHELFPLESFDDMNELNEYLPPDLTYDVNNDFEILPDYYHLFHGIQNGQPSKNRKGDHVLQPGYENYYGSIMHYSGSRYSVLRTNNDNLLPNFQHNSLDSVTDLNIIPESAVFDPKASGSDDPLKNLDDYYNLFKDAFKLDKAYNYDGNNVERERYSDHSVDARLPHSLHQSIADLPLEIIDVSSVIKNGQGNENDRNQFLKILLLSELFNKDGNEMEWLKSLLPFLYLS